MSNDKKKNTKGAIDGSDLDPDFKYEIAKEPTGKNILKCFQCGTCTAGCPVRAIDPDFGPRRIIRMAVLGLREEVLQSKLIWLCSTCYNCYERCPQDVRFAEIATALRNIAVREGHRPASVDELIKLLKEHGRLIEIGEFDNQMRAKMGLPEIRETPEGPRLVLEKSGVDDVLKRKEGRK